MFPSAKGIPLTYEYIEKFSVNKLEYKFLLYKKKIEIL